MDGKLRTRCLAETRASVFGAFVLAVSLSLLRVIALDLEVIDRKIFSPTESSKPYLFVSVAAHVSSAADTTLLISVLTEFIHGYACCNVDVRVDTNSNLTEGLLRFPPKLPEGRRLAVHQIPPGRMWHDKYKLTWAHRQYMHLPDPLHVALQPNININEEVGGTTSAAAPPTTPNPAEAAAPRYTHFMYTEADVLVPESAFVFYLRRYKLLWARGLLFQFFRSERPPASPNVVIANDFTDRLVDPPIYMSDEGDLYTTVPAYQAFWVLDRSQLAAFVTDPSCLYVNGGGGAIRDFYNEGPYGTRERMAIGYSYIKESDASPSAWPSADVPHSNVPRSQSTRSHLKRWHGPGTWLQRTVMPLENVSGQLRMHRLAAVNHTSNRFASTHSGVGFGVIPAHDVFEWPGHGPRPAGPLPDMRPHLQQKSSVSRDVKLDGALTSTMNIAPAPAAGCSVPPFSGPTR